MDESSAVAPFRQIRVFRAQWHDHRMPATIDVNPDESADQVLSTQEAADLVGVSRPYLVARIDAGDIPLYQQVGNQRRVMKSAVLAWHRREHGRRQRALTQLGTDLDNELFSS
jgi:excisionase family DNA binding protein